MTREQENRRLAEWLEPLQSFIKEWTETPVNCAGYDQFGNVKFTSPGKAWFYTEREHGEFQPADFYRDEKANAMLLEKIFKSDPQHIVGLSYNPFMRPPSYYMILHGGQPTPPDADRKAAIVAAFLKFIEAEGR